MKPGDAAVVVAQLTTALEEPKETSADRLRKFSKRSLLRQPRQSLKPPPHAA